VTLSAEELYRRGVELSNAGRNAAARKALTAAQARDPDPDLRARIAGTLAYVVARTGDPDGAERLCRGALEAEGLSPHTAAVLHGQLGVLALGRGDFDDAQRELDRAIVEIGDDAELRASMHLNRSVVAMQRGRLDAARADLDRAAADFAAAGMHHDAAMAVHNLGYAALLEGDLVAALDAMDRARRVLGDDSSVNGAICDVDRAEVLRDAGLPTEAERILARVARTFGAHGMRQSRAEAEFHLARSLLGHDPVAAARVAGVAARRFRSLGSTSWAVRADALRVRAALAEGRRNVRGEVVAKVARLPSDAEVAEIVAALERTGFRRDAAVLRATAELRRAQRGLPAGSAARTRTDAPLEVRLLAREAQVARAAARGREADIRRQAAAGIDELARWQASFGSLDLQSAVSMHGQPLMMAGLSSAMRSGSADLLFDWSERARHFNGQVVPLQPPPDPELAADLAELRMLRAAGGDWLAGARGRELQERVRARQWAGTRAARIEERVSLADLQARLDADTAVLAYAWSEGSLACVVVTRACARVVPLPGWQEAGAALPGLRADLDVSAAVRSGPLGDVVRRSLEGRLAELSRLLAEAPVAEAGTRRLVLTTPGVLAGLPWAMLPAMQGHPFTLAASATRWVRRGRPRADHARAGIAVGPRVARGEEEADAVAAAWRAAGVAAATLRGEAASVDAVAGLAADVSVLHVAAHGRHASDNPLFSGVELADGTLFGYDIDRIPRMPDTVVLSACEVGRSSVRWGEESVGMTRTWLHAGARCVVAAPVVVADDVACELLGAVHEGLARGEAPAEALAAAAASTGHVAPFECHGAGF